MDYDRWDALLHHIFKQTQGDAWFRPQEESLTSGVALRVNDSPPEFRVFPYENIYLEPFEAAVQKLNPVVAVKVRSAAVHAALADVPPDATSIYVDNNTRIQIIDTMLQLPQADREQCAAFIRDERVLVVFTSSLDTIIPTCQDFEDRLIKLLWRSRPGAPSSTAGSILPRDGSFSVTGHGSTSPSLSNHSLVEPSPVFKSKVKRNWYGKKVGMSAPKAEVRDAKLYAPFYNGLAAALALVFVGNGIKTLLMESLLDSTYMRFALFAVIPLLFCVSLFFTLQIVQNVTMAIGPIAHYHVNSKYYSAIPPLPNDDIDNRLPHITIQMPVYKENLDSVLDPSFNSIKRAMRTYARQGGTSSIFVNDDGLRLISMADRDERIAYYATHGIAWVARPRHGYTEGTGDVEKGLKDHREAPFVRAGRFKKASNMNYGLSLSLKVENHLDHLMVNRPPQAHYRRASAATSQAMSEFGSNAHLGTHGGTYGMQYLGKDGDDMSRMLDMEGDEDTEEMALQMAMEQVYDESGLRFRPWAAFGKGMRIGEIILLVDSDTIVPEDCLRDAAREMAACPNVAIIQHESDVMQVANHYFENGIAYFTRRINRCISMACANGEVAPFVGHNAFLRWKALQDAAFVDPDDKVAKASGEERIWSESNVSEDFDMALRLLMRGFDIRWATYSNGGFKEGVSLTVDDELNRWQKYAYGCNELLFNPLVQWFRKGPIAHQINRFMWCKAPIHYKLSVMAYMFSYYGIAASVTIGIINYALLGFQFPVDGFYMHSFEIWLATTVVFFGSGNVGYTLLEYRLGHKPLVRGFIENVMWVPFFFFFFGGLSIPVSQALLAHLFSYDITWSATIKEVQRSNFFKEIPKIAKRFWFPLIVSTLLIAGMIILSTSLVPLGWRVDGSAWAVIFPLSVAAGCHILFPIVLNPWLMVFSY
ncbi:glycosyl transferase family group 2-domain-containing protein [Armillaria novae-zelandiae]|uniref:Glycosyl transferase family group 2-domain-containing protein n=1 Tax=Armillaria novae-zelandiae TaxID=153914 RepID=A0AA39P1Q2_9AGAR|nr:glycosyl transferase family group 2-domain-containing protein [Armillaria novae-zelandiae]